METIPYGAGGRGGPVTHDLREGGWPTIPYGAGGEGGPATHDPGSFIYVYIYNYSIYL